MYLYLPTSRQSQHNTLDGQNGAEVADNLKTRKWTQ